MLPESDGTLNSLRSPSETRFLPHRIPKRIEVNACIGRNIIKHTKCINTKSISLRYRQQSRGLFLQANHHLSMRYEPSLLGSPLAESAGLTAEEMCTEPSLIEDSLRKRAKCEEHGASFGANMEIMQQTICCFIACPHA